MYYVNSVGKLTLCICIFQWVKYNTLIDQWGKQFMAFWFTHDLMLKKRGGIYFCVHFFKDIGLASVISRGMETLNWHFKE